MGRAAIDEEAIRQIEASHPDVEFDWPQILKGQGGPAETGEPPRRGRDRAGRSASRTGTATPPPPSISQETDVDDEVESESTAPPPEEPSSPAEARLGSQGLARLRARYAELLTRIADRVPEPERQEELKTVAERLNPDAWITDADVTAGLEAYEPTYEMVRSSLPPRRKPADPV